MRHTSAKEASAEILRDIGSFEALRQEWDDLYHHCPSATPFQSWAWLFSWWEHYGEGYELRLLTVREEGGLLVGMVPLMLERVRGIFGRLLFVGTGPTSYLDLLAREGWEREVYWVAVDALQEMEGWQVADLQEGRPEALVRHLFELWEGPCVCLRHSNCVELEAKPWEELLGSLSKNHRKTARRALRRTAEAGIHREPVGTQEAAEAARRLVALSREQWRGRERETNPDLWTRSFEAHLEVVAQRITSSGLGMMSEFRRGGETVVSTLFLFGREHVGAYMVAASQEILHKYSFSSLYIWDAVDLARSKGLARVNLMRGEEPYKLRWAPELIPNRRIILGRNRLSWGPYASYLVLRPRVNLDPRGWFRWVRDATRRTTGR